MPKTRKEKEKIVKEIRDNLDKAYGLVWLAFSRIPTNELTSLRREVKKIQAKMKVVKKKLFQIAWKDFGKDAPLSFEGIKNGNLVSFFAFEEENFLPLLKVIEKFRKSFAEDVKIIAGWSGDTLFSDREIVSLAKIPSRETLLAKISFSLKSPFNNLVYCLKGNLTKLVFVLEKVKEQKGRQN